MKDCCVSWCSAAFCITLVACAATVFTQAPEIGREVAVPRHLQDGEEFGLSIQALNEHGRQLFAAVWTIQEGGGRPLTKGTGNSLTVGRRGC